MQAPTATPVPTLPASGLRIVTVELGGVRFATEVADTGATWAQGLSDREALAPDAAMLFVYESPREVAFWMRGMRFPLDMVWIDAGLTVTGVTANVPPPAPDTAVSSLPTYPSGEPVRYVLEINAGVAGALGIEPGMQVSITGP